jgi:hypothetical protein
MSQHTNKTFFPLLLGYTSQLVTRRAQSKPAKTQRSIRSRARKNRAIVTEEPRLQRFCVLTKSKRANLKIKKSFGTRQIKPNQHQILHTSLLEYYELIPKRSLQKAQSLGTKMEYILLKMGFS